MKIKIFQMGVFGTNCYLVRDEESGEAMIIDPGAYRAEVEKDINGNGLVLKYIVLTHGHGDHTGGVPGFMESFPGAKLAAGAKEADLLGDSDLNGAMYITGDRLVLEPDIWLCEGDNLTLGELSFNVIETPGHTPGGLTFYVSGWDRELLDRPFSGTAFTGDTLFQNSVGRTDLPGGDFSVMKKSIREKIFTLPDDTIVLPGHMDVTTVGNEKKYNPFI